MSNQVSIKVDTVDGTATEGSDYRGIHEVFTMEPNQTELPIQVEIGEECAEAELLISTCCQWTMTSGSRTKTSS